MTRLSIDLLLLLCATLDMPPDSPDMEAAFLQSFWAKRLAKRILSRQSREIFPGLELGQPLAVSTPLLGFADSARSWWTTIKDRWLNINVVDCGRSMCVRESALDPASSFAHSDDSLLVVLVAVHVDDLRFVVLPECLAMAQAIQDPFPYSDFSHDRFEYCGKTITTMCDGSDTLLFIAVGQDKYVEGRLDLVALIVPNTPDDRPADPKMTAGLSLRPNRCAAHPERSGAWRHPLHQRRHTPWASTVLASWSTNMWRETESWTTTETGALLGVA